MGQPRARSHAQVTIYTLAFFTRTANVNFVFADILGHVGRGEWGDGSVIYPGKGSVVESEILCFRNDIVLVCAERRKGLTNDVR